jgi:DNA-binding SARP family transcriptional activator
MQQGDYEAAIAASQAVLDSGVSDPVQRDHALLNLVTLHFNYGSGEKALALARDLERGTSDSNLRAIAQVTAAILLAATGSDIEAINRRLRAMAESQRAGSSHHFGVSMLNLAGNSIVQDRPQDALAEVALAVEALETTTGSIEWSAARALQAGLLLRLGRVAEADTLVADLVSGAGRFIPNEAFAEAADAFDSYGSPTLALALLDRVGDASTQTVADRRHLSLARARMAIRRGEFEDAARELAAYPDGLSTVVGARAALGMARAQLALARGESDAGVRLRQATVAAGAAGAHGQRRVGELLLATSQGPAVLSMVIMAVAASAPWHLSFVAEELIPHLSDLTHEAMGDVVRAAQQHRERWRTALRRAMASGTYPMNMASARLLEDIGERSDIAPLRRMAKLAPRRMEASDLGRSLARRLADRVQVEDQGRVSLLVGNREVAGSSVRRKVLALLCFLLTRPGLSATRDQVLEALWPDLDPEVAINSLNQTIYFLRRVFEENYSDELSPGYVHHDSDVVWLDPELVSSRSVQCRRLIRSLPTRPSPDEVEALSTAYVGRFALDFEYEEWAAGYRDPLHAAYLEVMERAVLDDFTTGHYDRGILLARRALDVDPSAEQIEVCLLRLYRVTGAHSAAAEQYAHYATVMREELGIEPPPLESL